MRKQIPHSAAVALAATVALTSLDLTPASAVSITDHTQATKTATIDLSARRRHHWSHGDRAMLGAIAGVFGAIAATAAAHRYRERYYYGEPYYYGPYDAPYAYAPGYPGYRWHHRHHWRRW